jgi:hypothetical protein
VKSIVAWVKAIRAAAPDVLHWSEPVYRRPAEAPSDLFEAFNILCPNRPMWLRGGLSRAISSGPDGFLGSTPVLHS